MKTFIEWLSLNEARESLEKALRNYILDVAPNGSKHRKSNSTKVERVQWEVADASIDVVKEVTSKLGSNFSVVRTDKSIGGRSGLIAMEVTTNVDVEFEGVNIPKGSKTYIGAYSKETGFLNNKELTPDKLITVGTRYTATALENAVVNSLTKKFPKNSIKEKIILPLLLELVDEACGYGADVSYWTDDVSLKDLKIISKDFGEILSALYILNNTRIGSVPTVVFPSGNNKLVDYEIYAFGQLWKRISVKSGSGGPPSLQSIADKVKKITNAEAMKEIGADEDIMTVLGIMTDSQVKGIGDKTLTVGEIVCPEACEYVRNWLGISGDLTVISINTKLNEIYDKWKSASPQEQIVIKKSFDDSYKKFVSENGTKSAKDAISLMFDDSNKKRYGIITSPMGYNICSRLNKNPRYTNVLNNIIKTIEVHQHYIDVTKNGVTYKMIKYSDGNFVFEANATARMPNNRGFSFRMK